jgi:hypothetical protein
VILVWVSGSVRKKSRLGRIGFGGEAEASSGPSRIWQNLRPSQGSETDDVQDW